MSRSSWPGRGAKLTQEQLAERVSVSPQYVSDLERGVVGVSISTLKRICTTLGVTSDQILFGTQPESSFSSILLKCNSLSQKQITLLGDIVDRFVTAIESERK